MAKAIYKEWLTPQALQRLEGWKRNGLTDEEIAHNIGIRRETLWNWQKKHHNIANALKRGKEDVNFIVESALLKKALGGNITAIIFYLKNNWRDKYNDSELSPEERKLAVARMKKLEAETKNVQLRNKSLEENGADVEEALDRLLTRLDKEESKDEHERPADS